MLIQIPCPKCGNVVDVEPNASAPCARCGASVVGWVRKSGRTEEDSLPKHQRGVKQTQNIIAALLAGVLILGGIVCAIFVSIWLGLILIGIGAILLMLAKN